MFTAESFGADCPANWEEICDFMNALAAERGIDENSDRDEIDELWESYFRGEIPGSPEVKEVVYRVYEDTVEIKIDKYNGVYGPENLTETMIQNALLDSPDPVLKGAFDTEEEAAEYLRKNWPVFLIDNPMGMGVKYIPVTGAWIMEVRGNGDESLAYAGFSAMPEPEEEEQDPDEAFDHLYSNFDIWYAAKAFYDGGYRDGDEEDLMVLFRDQREENNRKQAEKGSSWRHTEETDRMFADRLMEEFRKIEADHKAAAEEEAVTEIEYHGRIVEIRPVRYKYNDDPVQEGVLVHDTADEFSNGDAIYGNGWKFDDIHDVEDLVSLFCETPSAAFERMPDGIYKITE